MKRHFLLLTINNQIFRITVLFMTEIVQRNYPGCDTSNLRGRLKGISSQFIPTLDFRQVTFHIHSLRFLVIAHGVQLNALKLKTHVNKNRDHPNFLLISLLLRSRLQFEESCVFYTSKNSQFASVKFRFTREEPNSSQNILFAEES